MNSKKKLLALIEETEKDIKKNKMRFAQHQNYFTQFAAKNNLMVLGLFLIPAVVVGWQVGKNGFKTNLNQLKPLAKVIVRKGLSIVRKLYLPWFF